jgi:uncharacterized Zn-binding protein involved in type VI secretion
MPPAARIGDMHVCPLVNPGPVPHVGGPISAGFPMVQIGFMPAARVGDMAVCAGPPDAIAMGSPTVQVGGMMSARQGDPTVHGGVVAVGFPMVDIGLVGMGFPGSVPPLTDMTFTVNADGTATGTFGPNIVVNGTPEFVSQTLGELTALSSLESGQAVIQSLGNTVTISEVAAGDQNANVASGNFSNPSLFDGTGAAATVGHSNDTTVVFGGGDAWQHIPPHVALGHELTHASHITNGDLTTDPSAGPPPAVSVKHEERRTVGLPANATHNVPDYTGEPFSENTIRSDQGLPARPRYTANPNGW